MSSSTTSSKTTKLSPPTVGSDAIARRAYDLWEEAGRPDGADMQHWLQAERELAGLVASPAPTSPVAAAAPEKSPVPGKAPAVDSAAPFQGEKNRLTSDNGAAARRKPPTAIPGR